MVDLQLDVFCVMKITWFLGHDTHFLPRFIGKYGIFTLIWLLTVHSHSTNFPDSD